MSQTINLDTRVSTKVDHAFTMDSMIKSRLSGDNEFVGARTVRVHDISTVPLNDYDRTAGGNRYGTPTEVGDTVEELTMSQDKSFSGVIDKGNNLDQAINKAGKFMGVQMSEEVIPTYDRYCLSALANKAGKIVGNTAAIDKTNVIARFSAARKHLLDHRVPVKGRTWYVRTEVFNALVETEQFKNLDKIGTRAVVQGQVGDIFGAPVVEVPEDLMPAQVNFILVHKRAASAPVKIWDNKVHLDPPGISGNLCEGRFYYDLFVFGAKADGVYVDVTGARGTVLAAPTINATSGAITAAVGASVKYTTDGSDPRYSATALVGTAPAVQAGITVRAYQYKDGAYPSVVAQATLAD